MSQHVKTFVLNLSSLSARRKDLDLINRFSPAKLLYLSLAGPKSFSAKRLFVCNCLGWEVIVLLVDIGGIVDHHCLKKS